MKNHLSKLILAGILIPFTLICFRSPVDNATQTIPSGSPGAYYFSYNHHSSVQQRIDEELDEQMLALFASRRQKVLDVLGGGVTILYSGNSSEGGRHQFRPDNYFHYLTGYPWNNAILILNAGSEMPFTLLVMPNYPSMTVYTGKLPGIKDTRTLFGADDVQFLMQFPVIMDGLFQKMRKEQIFINPNQEEFIRRIERLPNYPESWETSDFSDIRPLINKLRIIKDTHEISLLQRAIDITCEAQCEAYKLCKPGLYEYEIEALIEYVFRKNGSTMPGFRSIVGTGPNTTIMHYEKNSRLMQNGDLLLMDIGAEFNAYTGDVTRTIPVNGQFTPEQKEIYELVLKAQMAGIDELKPGNGILEAHHTSTRILIDGLNKLGLITDPASDWQKGFYILYPISHWLGMDVHDVGDYQIPDYHNFKSYMFNPDIKGRELESGMVLTIEPGIYIRESGLEELYEIFGENVPRTELDNFIQTVNPVYKKYLNIGVRIEDDVLITSTGHVILSKSAPKTVSEVENLMKLESIY